MTQNPAWYDALDERLRRGHAAGMVALAAWPDRTEIHSGGLRDVIKRTPMSDESLFRIASVSKILTASIAMMMVDDALIGLDEPVERWLPELAGKRAVADLYGPMMDTRATAPITLRHLLSMTNGMGAYFGQTARSQLMETLQARDALSWTAPVTTEQFLRNIADLPLMFAPGERFLYHLGFELAGIIVERICGERLGVVMQRRLFGPLGMGDTGFSVSSAQAGRLVALTRQVGIGRFAPLADWESDRTRAPLMDRGGGGLISSARDLGKFGRLLLDGGVHYGKRLISAESIAEMTRDQVSARAKAGSPQFPGFWEQHAYGLGVCIAVATNHVSAVPGRFGWWGGTGTALFMDPVRNVAMVSLTQRMINSLDDSGNADSVMHAMLGA